MVRNPHSQCAVRAVAGHDDGWHAARNDPDGLAWGSCGPLPGYRHPTSGVHVDLSNGEVTASVDAVANDHLYAARVHGDALLLGDSLSAVVSEYQRLQRQRPSLSEFALYSFLSFGRLFGTPYREIESALPGCTLLWKPGAAMTQKRHWIPEAQTEPISGAAWWEQALEEITSTIAGAASYQTVAGEISGGVDSALVASIAARVQRQRGCTLIGYTRSHSAFPTASESGYAEAVATWCDIPLIIDEDDSPPDYAALTTLVDVPTPELTLVQGWGRRKHRLLAQASAALCLTGHGGDHMFGDDFAAFLLGARGGTEVVARFYRWAVWADEWLWPKVQLYYRAKQDVGAAFTFINSPVEAHWLRVPASPLRQLLQDWLSMWLLPVRDRYSRLQLLGLLSLWRPAASGEIRHCHPLATQRVLDLALFHAHPPQWGFKQRYRAMLKTLAGDVLPAPVRVREGKSMTDAVLTHHLVAEPPTKTPRCSTEHKPASPPPFGFGVVGL